MTAPVELLWDRLVQGLAARRLLPPGYERITAAELAAAFARAGDERLGELVRAWYYPKRYGDAPGRMSDVQAEELIAELVGTRNTGTRGAQSEVGAHGIDCKLCGRALEPKLFRP